MGSPFNWPFASRPGISYGSLTPERVTQLSPLWASKLPPDPSMLSAVQDTGTPELALSQPVLPPVPQSSGDADAPIIQRMNYGNFNNISLSIGLTDSLVLNIPPGGARRIYLFIVNTHPAQNMFLTFQVGSNSTLGIPILFNFGFIEYNIVVPQDDVHIVANGAATTGVLVYSNKLPNTPGE